MSPGTPQESPSPNLITTAIQFHQVGRFAEAQSAYLQVLAADPENFDALHLLGVLAHQVGNHAIAADLISKAVHKNPNHPFAFNNLGEAYKALHRLEDAERCYRQALEINSEMPEVRSNLGNALRAQGKLEEAEETFRQAVALRPDFALLHANLGNVLKDLGRRDEAEQAYRQALELAPELVEVKNNLLVMELFKGNLEEGLHFYEQRVEHGSYPASGMLKARLKDLQASPRWQGEPLEGQTLLVVAEQGAGDNLMMARYLPLFKKKKRKLKRLVVYSTPHMKRAFQSFSCVDEVVSMIDPIPEGFDFYCPIMSLPRLFKTNLDSIPAGNAYLHVPTEMQKQWRARLKELAGLKIGLVWAAGKLSGNHELRSIRLEQLAPLLEIEKVQLVSLQKGKEAEQLKALDWHLYDCMEQCQDFLDTAALVHQLDLVISVDTSVAHLAGALGKPVWLLNSHGSEWRWMLDREDSPWYPSMRIFRQEIRGDWAGVIEKVAAELAHMAQGNQQPPLVSSPKA